MAKVSNNNVFQMSETDVPVTPTVPEESTTPQEETVAETTATNEGETVPAEDTSSAETTQTAETSEPVQIDPTQAIAGAAQASTNAVNGFSEFTGHGATSDHFYTTVEQFQNAYAADSYTAAAEQLGYTASDRGTGGIYDTAQSLVAFTGNISNFIDNAQTSLNLPQGLNAVIDAVQVGIGSIRENFYELLEAQQQYGFGKGLRVWFNAKTAGTAADIVQGAQTNIYGIDLKRGTELYNQGISYDNQTAPVDVLIAGMNQQNQATGDWGVQLVGDAAFLSTDGGRATLVASSYGFDSAEAGRQRDQMLADFYNVVEYQKNDSGISSVFGALAVGVDALSVGGYATIDMANSLFSGNGLYGNIEDSMNAELERTDAAMRQQMQFKVLEFATSRGVSIDEARAILAETAFGEDGVSGPQWLEGSEEDSMRSRVRQTDKQYYDIGIRYDDDDGIYVNSMSIADRTEFANMLFGSDGIMNAYVDQLVSKYGVTREDAIMTLDQVYQLNIRFDENGGMYCISPEQALCEKYPQLDEVFHGDIAEQYGLNDPDVPDAIATIGMNAINAVVKPSVTPEKLREYGVSEEDILIYQNSCGINTAEYDVNTDRVAERIAQVNNQASLESDFDNTGSIQPGYYTAMEEQRKGEQQAQQSQQAQSSIPDAVSEDYNTSTGADYEYGN